MADAEPSWTKTAGTPEKARSGLQVDSSSSNQIKDVIQDLFQIQSAAHGYAGPQTQQELVRLITRLVGSLSTLSNDASTLQTQIPPEIIDYVDEGRNPDIYTREFVELVQKGNQYLKGKSEAFTGFRDALAHEITKAWPDMKKDVENVDFSTALVSYVAEPYVFDSLVSKTDKMPAYRNIIINLVSQFDILNIPEYAPPAPLDDPFSAPPALADKSLVSCYIPIYPLSQFWLSYSISAPHPPKALYYFKLFINGACVVSWGCGEENGFKGKTTYGLFDSGNRWMGEPGVDVRAFTFACGTSTRHAMHGIPGQMMEVRVYRSCGRKRIRPELEDFKAIIARSGNQSQPPQLKSSKGQSKNLPGGINLLNAGVLPDDHPRRFYAYSLLDPLDQPFATFRWYYRSWPQLEALGVTRPLQSPRQNEADPHMASSHPNDGPSELDLRITSPPSPPESLIDQTLSPSSISDISPLTIRSLSLPATPLIDLPPRHSAVSSPLKCAESAAALPPCSSAAVSQSRFAQLVRGSSRSPSPPKRNDSVRPSSPARLRRTASMGALVGAVQNAMKRHGRGSQETSSEELVERVHAVAGKKE
ncbi:MAG: hypothetical protein Q9210_004133 [Variospora velana]